MADNCFCSEQHDQACAVLKSALYDGRVSIPAHSKLLNELKTLERNTKTGKIDHAANSSNDVADALAGVVYGLTLRRENWVKHDIVLRSIPNSLKHILESQNSQDRRIYCWSKDRFRYSTYSHACSSKAA